MSFIRRLLKKYFSKSNSRVLFFIFILALLIRFLGVYPGFPPNHPDEPTVYGSVSRIILHGDFKPVLYSYGGLLPKLYAFSVALFFIPVFFLKTFISDFGFIFDHGIFPFLDNFRHSLSSASNFLYWARYLTAILGAFTVIVVYFLGKKLFNRQVGLVAAILLAVNYRHVISSELALADAPAAFFASFSVLLSLNLIKNPSTKSYLLAGIGLSLAISVKYFVYVIPIFFLCHAISILYKENIGLIKKIFLIIFYKDLLLSLFVCLIVFFAINPFILFDFDNFYHEYQYDSERFGVTSPISQLFNYDYHRSLIGLYHLVRYGIGDLLSFVIVIGFLYALFRKTISTLILAFIIVPFLIVFLVIAAPSSARYYTAIIPFLLLFPSFLIVDILKFVRIKVIKVFLFIIIMYFLAFPSFRNSFLSSLYFSSAQNQVSSLRWMEDNLPNGSRVAVSAAFLPLNKNLVEIDINPVGPTHLMSMGELGRNQVQWVVVSSHFTSSANSQLWIGSNLVEKAFFNDRLFWELIGNTYTSLVLQEVGAYRIKEFVKPFWQSPDRAIFIVRMPKLWQIKKDKLILKYDFENKEDVRKFSKSSLISLKSNNVLLSSEEGYDDKSSLSLDTVDCGVETKLFSDYFSIEKNRWYSVLGHVKRQANPIYKGQMDGFLRLDFYSEKNKIIKTYVSNLLGSGAEWQELKAAGISPTLAKYGKISFQLDKCFMSEKYLIDNLQVFLSSDFPEVDKSEYPFYDKELPKNFLWLPEL